MGLMGTGTVTSISTVGLSIISGKSTTNGKLDVGHTASLGAGHRLDGSAGLTRKSVFCSPASRRFSLSLLLAAGETPLSPQHISAAHLARQPGRKNECRPHCPITVTRNWVAGYLRILNTEQGI